MASDDQQSLDELVKLEDRLEASLRSPAEVDGHDFGSDEANIFIVTKNPKDTFRAIQPLLLESPLQLSAAAFRDVDGESFEVLWPDGVKTFDVA